ncbi:uncharacterized protein LOC111400928 [Olea europaea var. sylvestris]|uniref:uncharacterized protein LOC111400928 n=1 Tax=Olea europaea var. sylvestris TaxID=158386 RepID=UPI000C1CF190|nr:uncharacterized protein LOC111400928 [Olea europaea var. sylvestris]
MDQRNALDARKNCPGANNVLRNNITELDSTAQSHEERSRSTENTVQRKKRRRKHKKMKAKNKDKLRGLDQMDDNLEVASGCTVVNSDLQNNLIELDSTAQSHAEQSKLDIRLTENLREGTMQRKRRRRKQNKKKAKNKDELQSLDQMDDNLETPSIGIGISCNVGNNNLQKNLIELDSTAQSHAEQSKMGTRSTENLAEGLVQRKRRWRKDDKKRASTKDKLPSANCMSSLNLSDINHGIRNDDKLITNESTTTSFHLVNDTTSHVGLGKHNETSLAPVDVDSKSCSKFIEQGSGPSKGPREKEVEMFSWESRHILLPDKMYGKNEKIKNEYNEEEIIVNEGKDSAVCSSYDVDVTKQLYSPSLKQDDLANDSSPYLEIAPVASVRRKLLVLDVNGLLADILMPAPTDCIADTHILGRAVFRRPFCDDFLKFCFENFDVAIWSSRSKKIIEKVVNYLLGDLQHKLLFCWDISQSTQTGFKTLENMHKPLVMKELKKIWEKDDPNFPWEKGYYNESNTLLLDDSPYKALLNPPHTTIFPYSYRYKDKSDNSLGPGGNLRVYLEDMLKCDNVKKYVEQHPFGQGAIDGTNEFWSFYSRVLESLSALSV